MGYGNVTKLFVKPLHIKEMMVAYDGQTINIEGTDVDIVTVLQKCYDDLVAIINSGKADPTDPESPLLFTPRPNVDPKCGGNGYYSKKEDTQNEADVDIKRLCNSCGSYGWTDQENNVIKQWTLTEEPKTDV